MNMKIAISQFDMPFEDIETNKKEVKDIIKVAKLNHADLIVFPEMTLTGFTMKCKEMYDESIDDFFKELSQKYFIKIIYGAISKKDDLYYNSLIAVDGQKELLRYDKIHPFLKERNYYHCGNEIPYCNINGYNIIGFVCYDLRFPEIFQLASKNSDMIVVIASWPKERDEHWITLLKARAIENQCYVLGVNRVGHDPNESYVGHSVLFDPWGMQVNEMSEQEGLIYVYMEHTLVDHVRKNRNLKNGRREELYYKLMKEYNDKL